MAFTRKFLKGLLENFKSSDTADIEQVMDSILSEHGTTINNYKSRLEKFDDVDLEALKDAQVTLNGINKKLGNLSLDDLITEHNTVSTKLGGKSLEDVLKENSAYAEKEANDIKSKAIDELIKDYKFTSSAAERDIRSQISAMPMTDDGKAFKDAEKIMPALLADNKDAFIQGQKPPVFSSSFKSGTSNAQDEQTAFLKKHYGL